MSKLVEKLTRLDFPKLLFQTLKTYFRIEVEGLEHIPKKGKALIIPNHSGCSGLDAVILGQTLYQEIKRIPRILTLWTLFSAFPPLASLGQKLGLKRATAKTGLETLRKNNLLILFPEGVEGSFKPSSQRYHLQHFDYGFVRLALLSDSPIIPCVILGAEETNINLGKIPFSKNPRGFILPIPFNLFPLPAKWKIRFLPAIDLSHLAIQDTHDKEQLQMQADSIKKTMQRAIESELSKRRYVFFDTSVSRAT
jgi:1-acyl-sn-glycerol-3-phosphate acyltransferase